MSFGHDQPKGQGKGHFEPLVYRVHKFQTNPPKNKILQVTKDQKLGCFLHEAQP